MKKVNINADAMLGIVKDIFNDPEIDRIHETNGGSYQKELNVEYYTFKYRPASTEQILEDERIAGAERVNTLAALDRGFCCFVLGDISREPAKDIDIATADCIMDFWVQSNKIKLLEDLIAKTNALRLGHKIPVSMDGQTRKAQFVFDVIQISEIDPESQIGEAVRVTVGVTIMLTPNTTNYADYVVELANRIIPETGVPDYKELPVTNIAVDVQMVPRGVPLAADTRRTGTINLSRGRTIKLAFEGHDNEVVDWLSSDTMGDPSAGADNNATIWARITRKGVSSMFQTVVVAHSMSVSNTMGSETHNLSLAERGL